LLALAKRSGLLGPRYPRIGGGLWLDEKPSMPSKLATDILNYTDQVSDFHTPEHILDVLDIIASEHCRLNVSGAALLPMEFIRGY
jgi:hypothetical protein